MPRIITLYLIGQVTKISFLTLIVLFSVFFLNEFTAYLEKVSSGELYPELLILVSIYSMSEIVEVVLPLSVFIGTIIAIYRLDQNNELLAFSKMGLGKRKVVLVSCIPAIFFALFVALVSFYLTPLSNNKLAFLNDVERFSDRFKLMGAEKINVLDDLNAIFYAKEASDRGFQDVFSSFETNDSEFVLTADELISKPLNKKENRISFESGKFSVLSEAMPLDFSFDEFFLILPKKPILNVEDLKRKYFHELIFAKDLERIELLKRSSMPLIIIISALIAASLTMRLKDTGRFYIFLSGLIIFMSYYGLSLSQEVFSNFSLNSTIVFFSIHGIYLIAAIMLALDQSYQNFSFNLGGLKYSRNFMIDLLVLFLIATVFSYLVFYVFL
ncbi:MAG: LptF/LptG family permease [SAR86 cluster bacterium]|uniref:LptF/LptG family permease n=1 Tax=SAR86 cluster bacterium TaxID=2030880 RepID=A0A937HVV0_9GAMM|nr:LptF/LptG family permease [SAR86 cluster bacterium]